MDRRGFVLGAAAAVAAPDRLPSALRAQLRGLMERNRVPGVSYALVDGTTIRAGADGVRRAGGSAAVDDRTLFQAASLSKIVTAVVALVLAGQEKIDLDADVTGYLKSWRLPESDLTKGNPVTMRRLLGMTAGVTGGGYPGYAPGADLPTLIQTLDGTPPANAPGVRIEAVPGTKQVYSSGGYEIVQAVIEDVTGQRFADAARALVLGPAGMTSSTFAQPLPADLTANVAQGHLLQGTPLPGGWMVLPELAAAGLWTTATDMARFMTALVASSAGSADALLTPAALLAMLTPVDGMGYGLGAALLGSSPDTCLEKAGHNLGYVAYLLLFPEDQKGGVLLTSGEGGFALIKPFFQAAAAAMKWPPTTDFREIG